MILKGYLKHIQDLVDKDPTILNREVVYSVDDEGNEFKLVTHPPTICSFKDGEHDDDPLGIGNAICIN